MSDLMVTHFAAVRQFIGYTAVRRSIEALRVILRTYFTRQALPELTAHQLADIGVTRMTALDEAARLPWDVTPPHRRRTPGGMVGTIQQAVERARSRRLLARMQARELGDLGISLSDAQAEASKPFWRQ